MAINPLTGKPYNWTDQQSIGSLDSIVNDPGWATYGQLQSGDSAAFDPAITAAERAALMPYLGTGATLGYQDDGRMMRTVARDANGSILYATEPQYHQPDNVWKDAVLPMAAFALGAPALGSAMGIPIPVGTPTLSGLFGGSGGIADGGYGEVVAGEGGSAAGGIDGLAGTMIGDAPMASSAAGLGMTEAGAAAGGIDALASGMPLGDAPMASGTGAGFSPFGQIGEALKATGITNAAQWLKDNPMMGKLLFSGAGALLSASGSKGGSGGYVDSGYRPTVSRDGWSANPQAKTQAQGLLASFQPQALPKTGNANSGLWRYGLLGG